MNKPSHDHKAHEHHDHRPRRGIHRDWRLWAVVILMLAAMGMYIMTNDEADVPGGDGQRQPAAPAAP